MKRVPLSNYKYLLVITSMTMAHQAFATRKTPRVHQALTVELPGGSRCEVLLSTGNTRPTALATPFPVSNDDILGNNFLNGPREIALLKESNIPRINREIQLEKARKLAEFLAEQILKSENLDSEEGLIKVQDLLANSLGRLPEGSLQSIESILEADLGALNDPKKMPTYQQNTQNALAHLTEIVTEYREHGFDVNTVANKINKIASYIPFARKFLKTRSNALRENFQSVKQAIDAIDGVLEESVAKMRMRQQQMKEARLELKRLELYLEISNTIAHELQTIVVEYRDSQEMGEDAKAIFNKNIVIPIASRINMIQRNQATVVTAYHQFTLLMDGNLDLIVIVGNIRETAKLEASVFGAGKLIANEQHKSLELAKATQAAVDDLRSQTVEEIKKNGIRVREFRLEMINSSEKMMAAVTQLENELQVAKDNTQITIAALDKSNAELQPRLDRAIASMRDGQIIDLIRESDQVNSTNSRHETLELPAPK